MRLWRRGDGTGLGCHAFGADGLRAGDQDSREARCNFDRSGTTNGFGVGYRAAGDSAVNYLTGDLLHSRFWWGRSTAAAADLGWCRCGSWRRR